MLTTSIRVSRWAILAMLCANHCNFCWFSLVPVETWKCWLWRYLLLKALLSNGGSIEVACHQFHGNKNMMLIWHLILAFHLDDLDSNSTLMLFLNIFLLRLLFNLSLNPIAYYLLFSFIPCQLCLINNLFEFFIQLHKSWIIESLVIYLLEWLTLKLIQVILICCRNQWCWILPISSL